MCQADDKPGSPQWGSPVLVSTADDMQTITALFTEPSESTIRCSGINSELNELSACAAGISAQTEYNFAKRSARALNIAGR